MGDWVLVYAERHLQSKKLHVHLSGPFQVTRCCGCLTLGNTANLVPYVGESIPPIPTPDPEIVSVDILIPDIL